MLVFALLLFLQPEPLTSETAIAAVRDGFLPFNNGRTIEKTFEINPWYTATEWQAELKGDSATVHVKATLNDTEAVEKFMAENQYAFRKNFKAMQLQHVYGLIGERDGVKLRFSFKVHADQSFDTVAGDMLVRHTEDGEWHVTPLSNKAIVEIMRGIYARENPFESFIRGLPFK